nr:hypothetical protein [Tanacetum cinerariifolium]
GLDLTYAPSTITTQQPSKGEVDLLFKAMYNDYIGGQPSATARTVLPAQEPQVCHSGLDLTYAPSTITTQQPTEGELDLLFEPMYDDYFGGQPSANVENVPPVQEPQVRQTSTASTTIADKVPIPTNSSSHATNIPITSPDVDELNPNAIIDGNTFVNPFANSSTSAAVAFWHMLHINRSPCFKWT